MNEQLDKILNPGSIAVIGASTNKSKFGYQTIELLKGEGYAGKIFPINPNAAEILGLPCYRSLSEAPEVPDVVALLIPAEHVLSAVKECVERKVPGVVIISSGFGEAGEKGRQMQKQLHDLVMDTDTRIVGPNCEGLINIHHSMALTFSSMFTKLGRGPVSIISHSGSYSGILARRTFKAGVGLSKIVSAGNEVDLSAIDYLQYLADDPHTNVILCYFEELRKPAEFKRCLAEITRKKPVVVQKAGRTDVGSVAVSSHTGALAGSDRVISAFLKQSGAVRVTSINEVVYAGLGLATQPLAKGNRVAIVSGVGGLAVEAAEPCAEAGLSIPKLGDPTHERLKAILPYFASCNNPVDMTGAAYANPTMVGAALEAILDDPDVDAVLFILTIARSVEFARVVYETIQRYDKPVLMCWTAGTDVTPEPLYYLTERGVPIFDSPEQLRTAMSAIVEYSRYRLGADFVQAKGR